MNPGRARLYLAQITVSVFAIAGLYVASGQPLATGLLVGTGAGVGIALSYACYDSVMRNGSDG